MTSLSRYWRLNNMFSKKTKKTPQTLKSILPYGLFQYLGHHQVKHISEAGLRWGLPAVDHHGSCICGVAGLDPAEEGQGGGGVLRHSMVRPGHELELTNLSLLTGAILVEQGKRKLSEHHRHTLVAIFRVVSLIDIHIYNMFASMRFDNGSRTHSWNHCPPAGQELVIFGIQYMLFLTL